MTIKELKIKTRSSKIFSKDISIQFEPEQVKTLNDLVKIILKSYKSKLNKHRVRLTVESNGKQIAIDENLGNIQNEIFIKDLGPQISWRLVFMIEYFGPIAIHTLLYQLALINYTFGVEKSTIKSVYLMHIIHYLKREFESVFVHSFSNATMPLFNVFKNSFHYWILNGIIGLGYLGYGFNFAVDLNIDSKILWGLFLAFEFCNLLCHVKLRQVGDALLKKGIKERKPIDEGVFKYLVSPNYTFEVLSWVIVTIMFKFNLFAVLFLLVSATQMYLWALKKNKKYKTRKAFLIPYVF
ncbi:hypothetical protein QEN19_003645 [Hanseniaspora menglaensis]